MAPRPGPVTRPPICVLSALVVLASSAIAQEPSRSEPVPEIAVVVSRDSPLSDVRRSELVDLFLGTRSSLGEVRARPVNLAERTLKFAFLTRLTRLRQAQIEDQFVTLELRGEARRATELSSPADLVRLTFEVRGVVGWLPVPELDRLTSLQRQLLKVLTIDGRKPGDKDYALAP